MDNETSVNEKLAYRLADILTRLNNGESLDPVQLAETYKTSERTIHRDLTERFAFLPLKKSNGSYALEQNYLGKLDFKDIQSFAALAGVSGMFPSLDRDVIRQLLDSRASLAYTSIGQTYENPSQFKSLFVLLERAISAHHVCSYTYKESLRTVEPYKLVNHRGRWYLAAVDNGVLKAYRVSLINNLQVDFDAASFQPKLEFTTQIDNEKNVWFGTEKEEVIITVDPMVASYFQSKQLLPEQQTIKELDNGGMIISSRMNHVLEILPLVKYWIPHLRIISPDHLQQQLEDNLRRYLNPPIQPKPINN